MSSGKRLTYYIGKQGFTKKEFCNKYSFEYNNLVTVMSDKRPLGINILDRIHYALPKMNVHWLLYGEGPEEIEDYQLKVLNEPAEMYIAENDTFEYLLLKYMDNEKIKNKIYEIIKQKAG